MTTKTRSKEHAYLLKAFHTKCTKANIDVEEKYAMVAAYGHSSSRDMTINELADACRKLDNMLNPSLLEADKWRKRVMAAISGWLKLMSQEADGDKLKSIACRASGFNYFNEIPKDRLVNLYYAFKNKQKDFQSVDDITKMELENLTFLN